jgi:multiple antibiotic resistance protein
MVLWRNHPHASGHAAVILGIVAAVACVGVALLVADRVTRAVRPSVIAFLTRVFGLLLSAIAVQLVIDGVTALT